MKHLLLIATGGTIASVKTENGLSPAKDPGQLLSYIPEAEEFCRVDVKELFNMRQTVCLILLLLPVFWGSYPKVITKACIKRLFSW